MIFAYKSGKENNTHVFHLSGELIDRNQGQELLAEADAIIAAGQNKIVLNLQKLDYINSSGLNVLINILTRTRKASGDTAICCVNKKITELLVITKLDSIFNVCDNEEEAMEVLYK